MGNYVRDFGKCISWVTLMSTGFVAAQPQICSGSSTFTAAASLSALSACSTFVGDITIAGVPVPIATSAPVISLPVALHTITGALMLADIGSRENDGEWSLQLPGLVNVSNITFSNLQTLAMPNFEALTHAESINFSNVNFSVPAAFRYEADALSFPQPALLKSVLSLNFTSTNVLAIGPLGPNFCLTNDQGKKASVIAIGNSLLQNISLSGYTVFPEPASPVISEGVMTTVEILDNPVLQSVSFPDFGKGSLRISGNDMLTALSLPSLKSVSSLNITTNPQLSDLALPQLQSASTLFDISGPLSTFSAPEYHQSAGSVNITLQGSLECSGLGSEALAQDCRDVQSRSSASAPSLGSDTSESPSESSPSSAVSPIPSSDDSPPVKGGLSNNTKVGVGVGIGVGIPLLLGFVVLLCCCVRRRSRDKTSKSRTATSDNYRMAQRRGRDTITTSYSKVPLNTVYAEEMQDRSHHPRQNSSSLSDDERIRPDFMLPSNVVAAELEEQQGPRHEMDARSLPDMDLDDDHEETRSLQDIERARGH